MQTTPETHESIANATRSASASAAALAIAIGGALGASLRFAIVLGTQSANLDGAWAAASANLIGSFLLGVIVARAGSPTAHPLLRPFLVVGVFGSFTTFSALVFDNRRLAGHHGELIGLLHLVGSIAIGIVAFGSGAAMARRRR
jgi:CrcB protein